MVLLVTIAFFMAVAGCFIMLELSPFAFLDGLSGYLKPKNDSIRWSIVRFSGSDRKTYAPH